MSVRNSWDHNAPPVLDNSIYQSGGNPYQSEPNFQDEPSINSSEPGLGLAPPKHNIFYRCFHSIRDGPNAWVVLIFCCLLTIGSYFSYDTPGALAPILQPALHLSDFKYSMFYAVYSVPNALGFVFLGGIITDKLGSRLATLLFTTLVLVGTMLFALGGHLKLYWLMLIGRVVFGMGGESLTVAQNAVITEWFADSNLALAFGISLTISRLGTALVFNTEASIAHLTGSYVYALWFTALLCLFSLLSNIILNILDKAGEKTGTKPASIRGTEEFIFDWKQIRAFPREYWMLCWCVAVFYAAVFPLTANSTKFFHHLGYTPAESGQLTSIVIVSSMVLSPIVGQIVDKRGWRANIIVFGGAVFIPAQFILGFTRVTPIFGMSLIGLAFSLVPSAMWPSVPLILQDDQYIGTGYGIMTSIQNLFLFLGNALAGVILQSAPNKTKGFENLFLFFACLVISGFVSGIALYFSQKSRLNDILNKSLSQIQEEQGEDDKTSSARRFSVSSQSSQGPAFFHT